ncbi:MAG TPA: phage tail protein [Ruminiclostridium sp.]|nr:phage tail protein [Ruminiclostridium sp.]
MPVKRKTINLNVVSDKLMATEPGTGNPVTDAGFQGEDGAAWLHAIIPDDWSDLRVRLQVASLSGDCDESGLPLAGVIDMPLRANVTVPGRLNITLIGVSEDGIRRTAECNSLFISEIDCPADPVTEIYPAAFENLCNVVEHNVIHKITGSGGALVTKTDDTTYDISVVGTGGDMLALNYASGTGKLNKNTIDHAAFADKAGIVETAENAENAVTAQTALNAAAGSALESTLNSKQQLLAAGGSGVDLLSGNVIKSLKGSVITVTPDDKSVTLGINGGVAVTGSIMHIASTVLPDGWQFADGREVKISDYPDLFKAIGFRYGMGGVNCIHVMPTYFTDNCNITTDIVVGKYAKGINDISYFDTGGTAFFGDNIKLTESGDYTIYCKDSGGREAVQYLCVPPLTSAYLLSLGSLPLTDSLELGVFDVVDEKVSINLVKLAQGLQSVSFFAGGGTTIGTSMDTRYSFKDGTNMPSGNYTWYTKDSNGNEAVQYFNVKTSKTLTMNLSMCFGSDNFLLPNLTDTINPLISPCIKL